jgi:hypothetical protein
MPVTNIYLILGLGIVIGAVSVLAVFVWRKALAERERERYFSARVNRMPRRVS